VKIEGDCKMRKTVLILSPLFTSGLAYAAGGPIPGVDVSLEQIPGGTILTESVSLGTGGKIIHKRGKISCMMTTYPRKKVVKFKAGSEFATKVD